MIMQIVRKSVPEVYVTHVMSLAGINNSMVRFSLTNHNKFVQSVIKFVLFHMNISVEVICVCCIFRILTTQKWWVTIQFQANRTSSRFVDRRIHFNYSVVCVFVSSKRERERDESRETNRPNVNIVLYGKTLISLIISLEKIYLAQYLNFWLDICSKLNSICVGINFGICLHSRVV